VLQTSPAVRSVAIFAGLVGSLFNLNATSADQILPYKSDWMEVKATDGSIYKIDRKSIYHFSNASSEVIVFAVHDGPYDPRYVRRLWFDCQGHFQDHTAGASPTTEHMPPGSVAAQLSAIACSRTADRGSTGDRTPGMSGSAAALPASHYSARQVEAIRVTYLAGWADKHCADITSLPAGLGDTLIDAGIELSDFDTPEFKRIREEADAQSDKEPIQTRCNNLWRMFGPGGAYAHQLVRLRPPSDLFVERK
jgi:hypothetical protein